MGRSLNRAEANTLFTWLTAANNVANMRAYATTEIATFPNTNVAGELTVVTHHQLKFLHRANAYEQFNVEYFDF